MSRKSTVHLAKKAGGSLQKAGTRGCVGGRVLLRVELPELGPLADLGEAAVEPAACHQLVVRAALGDAPVLDDEDPVGLARGFDDLLVRRVGAAELDVIFDGVREEVDVLSRRW